MKRGPKPKEVPPKKRAPQVRTPGPMAAPLAQLLAERHLTARGLSLRCGLAGDTVRNLLSGRAHSPRGEVAQALADKLGVSVGQLYGKEPLPAPPTAPDLHILNGLDRIDELAFDWDREVQPTMAEDLTITTAASWMMPPGFFAERGLKPESLAVVRAPHEGADFRTGDRFLIDRGSTTGTPPGFYLIWDGHGFRIADCHLVRRGGPYLLRVERGDGKGDDYAVPAEMEIIGRVVGRWMWM